MKLDKNGIINQYKEFIKQSGVKPGDAIVGCGSAMVMHGLRKDTGDVDLDLRNEIDYKRLLKEKGSVEQEGLTGKYAEYSEYVDIHAAEVGEVVMISGVPCYSLSELKKFKVFMATHPKRMKHKIEQDLEDVRQIESMMAKTPNTIRHW